MKLIRIAFKYLKEHPILSGVGLLSIMLAAVFDGASLGMLIPLIQSMTEKSADLFGKIPFLNRADFLFSSTNSSTMISFIFMFIFVLLAVKNMFVYFSSVLIAKLRFCVIKDLRVKLMDNLLEYDAKYFDTVKTGHIISGISLETQRMGDFVQSVLQFVVFSGRLAVYIILLFLISWKASIVIFLLIITVLIPVEFIVKKAKKLGRRVSEALADFNDKLTEILSGIRLIKGSGTERLEKESFKTATGRVYQSMYRVTRYLHLIIPLSETLIFGLIIVCFLVFINVVKVNVTNMFPFIATFLLILARALTQLNSMNNMRSNAMGKLAAFETYENIYDKAEKQTIKDGNRQKDKFSDSIEFRNVNFSYITGKEVLKNVDIRIPSGKITAFVGASGAGKSTLVNLITRFYEATSGKILIDGTNLRELKLKDWRKKIGFVSQDIFIFNTSVRNNISYGHSGTGEKEIIKAAETANAHDFIVDMPDKYDALLGERGVKLSGGQKQRISIARAIIDNPEVLILDEATSSLDTETERLITEAVDKLTRNRTVIAIAHRLSTILHADNIIVLDNGRVIEEGRHADLLKKNGLYRRLYDAQFSI